MTPAVCRASRAALGITQRELATLAGVSAQTVVDFERSARTPHRNNLVAIQAAFEARGLSFMTREGIITQIDLSGLLS
ncbi:XRE family transcriptional regulator [Brevundimonas naejangsanensis]|uniref:XRE family transcriptional regulator n=1 Tax=Brevundimonas naejangsanensis TaxID=588932 RepID=A0A494RNI6_9CAUL|nr:XRE family transcriptional regulator [Brevundimonas naejangsanensis]